MRVMLVISLLTGAAACGGLPCPNVTAIEETRQGSTGLTRETIEFTYLNGDEVDRVINREEDGTIDWQAEVFYKDGRIDSITVTDPADPDQTTEIVYEYGDDGPSQRTETFTDNMTTSVEEQTIEYTDGRLSKITENQDGTLDWTRDFDYDDDDRLEKVTFQSGTFSSVEALSYDDDFIKGVTDTDNFGSGSMPVVTSYTFKANKDGHLELVTRSGGTNTWVVEYNDDGTIEQVRFDDGNGFTRTSNYKYGDGSIAGVLPTADLPYGHMFDMEGSPFPDAQLITFELFN